MASDRKSNKALSVHRLRLTHGNQAVPRLPRESTEQFFTSTTIDTPAAISVSLKRKPMLKPIVKHVRSRNRLPQEHREKVKSKQSETRERMRFNKIRSKSTPGFQSPLALPPIHRLKSRDHFDEKLNQIDDQQSPGENMRINDDSIEYSWFPISPDDMIVPPIESWSSTSFYSSPPQIGGLSSPTRTEIMAKLDENPSTKRRYETQEDRIRRASEKALEVARLRRLRYDPFELLEPHPTPRALYSYFDHVPSYVSSSGSSSGYYPKPNYDYDARSRSELARRRIFEDIFVEKKILEAPPVKADDVSSDKLNQENN